jgi:flagellar M-ring protein FliF
MMSLSKAEYFTIAELTVIGIMSLLVLMMVVRPLVRRILSPEAPAPTMEALAGNGANVPRLTGPDGELTPRDLRNQTLEAMDSARAVGEVQAKAMEDVGETVQNNPEEAVSIVRDWIAKTA